MQLLTNNTIWAAALLATAVGSATAQTAGTLRCVSLSSGAASTASGVIMNVGQSLVGHGFDGSVTLTAGVVPCLAISLCPADLTSDGVVNGSDLANLLVNWGSPNSPPADLNGDGVVDGADLANLLVNWGMCP